MQCVVHVHLVHLELPCVQQKLRDCRAADSMWIVPCHRFDDYHAQFTFFTVDSLNEGTLPLPFCYTCTYVCHPYDDLFGQ